VHGVLRMIVAGLALLGLLAGCSSGTTPPTAPSFGLAVVEPDQREPAALFTAELLDGSGTFELSDHTGDVIVINFWASWCGPCVAEAVDLEQTYQATKDAKVTFVGVNTRNDDRDSARQFVARHKPSFPSVFDPTGKVAMGFAGVATSMPATIVVDRSGRVAAMAFGAVARHSLEPVVTQLAAEAG
jgi:thiol-disulfide isomerase/thioredoxin